MNVLIVNLHSALNLGDDAIMAVTLDSLRRYDPTARITLAANDPESWAGYGLPAVPSLCTWLGDCRLGNFKSAWWRLPGIGLRIAYAVLAYRRLGRRAAFGSGGVRALVQAYYDADLVLSCGGGNFYAHRPFSPALFMALLTIAFGMALRKPLVMLPQSFGPIEGRLQRWLAGQVLRRVSAIAVRESEAAGFLSRLKGVPAPRLLTDLAFGFEPVPPRTETSPAPKIGVTILDRSAQDPTFNCQSAYEAALVQALCEAQEKYQAEIHIFVQCSGPSPDQDDRRVSERLYALLSTRVNAFKLFLHPAAARAADLRLQYARMDVMVGSRLHTAILALGVSTPVLLIAYQPKSIGIMRDAGFEQDFFLIQNLDAAALSARLDHLLSDVPAARQRAAQAYSDQHRRLTAWLEKLLAR